MINRFKKKLTLMITLFTLLATPMVVRADEAKSYEGPAGVEMSYLNGGSLYLLESRGGGQNLSSVIQTAAGKVIVIDGGREEDAEHLTEVVQSLGGVVDAWLLTHPHSDHVGALSKMLFQGIPFEVKDVYYSFLPYEVYESAANDNRMMDVMQILAGLQTLPEERVHQVKKDDMITLGDAFIHVMNDPYFSTEQTINNSSVAYRIDLAGKRVLYLGDMGVAAGENLLKIRAPQELKADIVQMSHHGQDGVDFSVYEMIAPEICLWPTPKWLWDNAKNGVPGLGSYKTLEVREWMKSLGVKQNLVTKDGDQKLK